jgi:predicted nuclease with TOPRIM domain
VAYSKKTKEKFEKLEKEIAEKDKQIKELEYEFSKKDEKISQLESDFQDLNIKYKYNQFDVEATRRELEYYKKLLRDQE